MCEIKVLGFATSFLGVLNLVNSESEAQWEFGLQILTLVSLRAAMRKHLIT